MSAVPWILAHQGGWDEALWFVVPVALGWWAIKAAEQRARRRRQEQDESPASVGEQDD